MPRVVYMNKHVTRWLIYIGGNSTDVWTKAAMWTRASMTSSSAAWLHSAQVHHAHVCVCDKRCEERFLLVRIRECRVTADIHIKRKGKRVYILPLKGMHLVSRTAFVDCDTKVWRATKKTKKSHDLVLNNSFAILVLGSHGWKKKGIRKELHQRYSDFNAGVFEGNQRLGGNLRFADPFYHKGSSLIPPPSTYCTKPSHLILKTNQTKSNL